MYGRDGRLVWYRSQHFADAAALRRGVRHLLNEHGDIAIICIEGGGRFAAIWERTADALGISTRQVAAETWRNALLFARDRRTGVQAKRKANGLARRVIEWSGAPRPTSLRHDASEAILIGLWAVMDAGWLKKLPVDLHV